MFHVPNDLAYGKSLGHHEPRTWRERYIPLAICLFQDMRDIVIGNVFSAWIVPAHVRKNLQEDLRGRFLTRERVVDTLQLYSPLHGGNRATSELLRLQAACGGYYPVPLYRKLLQQSGKAPQQIVTFVREIVLHVDSDPAVMEHQGVTRPFLPLETALSGIGQCTGAASLAAALIDTAGYEVRLWAVSGHTFFEWRSPHGNWQLEDVDVFPPGVFLPRGLSMRSLLESYADWIPILDALPTLNSISPSTCFVPTDNGQLHCWRHNLARPNVYDYQKNYQVGSVPRQFREISVEVINRNQTPYLRVSNPNPQDLIMIVCNIPFGSHETTKFDDNDIQHDVFMYAKADGLYDKHMAHSDKKLFACIPGGGEPIEICLNGLDSKKISIFTRSKNSLGAQLFLVGLPLTLEGDAKPLESIKVQYSKTPTLVQAGESAYQSVFENDGADLDAAALRYAQSNSPATAFNLVTGPGMPRFKGRVLDAGCGTGEYSIALADQADSVAAIDYTAGRVQLLEEVLQKLDPRPNIEPMVGSLESLPYNDDEFDSIYCRGVIFLTDLPRTLSEFYRVLKPGGFVYIDCNADAWNWYLMLDRGKDNPDAARQGRDTLYNSVWRRHSNVSLPLLRKSIQQHGLRVKVHSKRLKLDQLLHEMDRHICMMPPEEAAIARRLELYARQVCGEGHLSIVLKDILAVAAELQQGPTVTVGSHAWEPEEVQDSLLHLGFTNFIWWSSAGSRETPGKRPLELGPQLGRDYTASHHLQGSMTVWCGMFLKPQK